MKKSLLVALISLLMLSLTSPTCSAFYHTNSDAVRIETPLLEKDAQGSVLLTGNIQNVSGKELYAVSLRCVFYDDKGVQVANGAANISDIAINGIAKYKMYSTATEEIGTARITGVEVYVK